jgi:hypothetical protein
MRLRSFRPVATTMRFILGGLSCDCGDDDLVHLGTIHCATLQANPVLAAPSLLSPILEEGLRRAPRHALALRAEVRRRQRLGVSRQK